MKDYTVSIKKTNTARAKNHFIADLYHPNFINEISPIIDNHIESYRERIFSPVVTIQTFLSQVLSEDHSCRSALMKLVTKHACKKNVISTQTGAYCIARQRLPENLLKELMQITGRQIEINGKEHSWHGRCVKLCDGTTHSMPDTKENQKAYPQPTTQKKGLGFPLIRFVGILSLATGAVLDYAIAPYEGKGTSELALLNQLTANLSKNDVLLGDRVYANYFTVALLQERGVDAVFRANVCRKVDFRKGKPLGPKDHIVIWKKPRQPVWIDKQTYKRLPDTIKIRETRRGKMTVITTLLDSKAVPKHELMNLYQQRWHIELDLRSIKEVMQMDILRCKTPAMIRKEISMHLLGYNLIRQLMLRASQRCKTSPRSISFKATLQVVDAYQPAIYFSVDNKMREILRNSLLDAIIKHKVGNRPNRQEPRAIKRSKKQDFPRLAKPRKSNNKSKGLVSLIKCH